jgi:hypothetical protein
VHLGVALARASVVDAERDDRVLVLAVEHHEHERAHPERLADATHARALATARELAGHVHADLGGRNDIVPGRGQPRLDLARRRRAQVHRRARSQIDREHGRALAIARLGSRGRRQEERDRCARYFHA